MKFPMEIKHKHPESVEKTRLKRLPADKVMNSIIWDMDGLSIAIINSQHYSSLY
jgi:hypothetical protein